MKHIISDLDCFKLRPILTHAPASISLHLLIDLLELLRLQSDSLLVKLDEAGGLLLLASYNVVFIITCVS